MANPTTYFGWVMPNSADLVTDLPADFNVFGQGVDTSMQYLLGGTTGQVLSKTSGTNMAFTWVTPTDQTPLTTKGDLFTFSTVDARLAVGTNKYVLGADSTQSTGLAWQTSPQSIMTTTGDTLYASAANTPARLGIGSTGNVLTVAGGVPTWSAPAGGGKVLQVVTATTSTAVTNATTTYQNTTLTVSITPTLNTSKVLIMFTQNDCIATNGGTNGLYLKLLRDSTDLVIYPDNFWTNTANYLNGVIGGVYLDSPATTSATTYKTMFRNRAAVSNVGVQNNGSATFPSTIIVMEIGA